MVLSLLPFIVEATFLQNTCNIYAAQVLFLKSHWLPGSVSCIFISSVWTLLPIARQCVWAYFVVVPEPICLLAPMSYIMSSYALNPVSAAVVNCRRT